MLQKLTGIEPDRTVNPDEAVARGAALYAGHVLAEAGRGGPAATFEVTNVNAHSLGIEGIEQETLRKTNVILIPRNTRLARQDARSASSPSRKGSNPSSSRCWRAKARCRASVPPSAGPWSATCPSGLPKGWPVEVTFEYATNGRLSVRALVPGTHHQAELDLERDVGFPAAGIARWKVPDLGGRGVRRLRGGRPRRRWPAPAPAATGGLVRHPGAVRSRRRRHGPAADARRRRLPPGARRCRRLLATLRRRTASPLVGRRHAGRSPTVPGHAGLLAAGELRDTASPRTAVCPCRTAAKRAAKFPQQPGRQGGGPYHRRRAGPGVRLFACCGGCVLTCFLGTSRLCFA